MSNSILRFSKYFFSLLLNYILDNANNGAEEELVDSNEHHNANNTAEDKLFDSNEHHDDEKSSENKEDTHEGASIEGKDYVSYEEKSKEGVDGKGNHKKPHLFQFSE